MVMIMNLINGQYKSIEELTGHDWMDICRDNDLNILTYQGIYRKKNSFPTNKKERQRETAMIIPHRIYICGIIIAGCILSPISSNRIVESDNMKRNCPPF